MMNVNPLFRYSWEGGEFVLLRTKSWQKLRNGWFKAELTDGTSVSHMGISSWHESELLAMEDLIWITCEIALNRVKNKRVKPDPERHSKLIALGKLIESYHATEMPSPAQDESR